jgi:hypothetical protein
MPAKPRKPVDEAVVRAWVERTCAEQGVPVKATHPRIIERVVATLCLVREDARRRALLAQDHGRQAEKTSE